MTAISWANGDTGNWADQTKWSLGLVPTSADDVTVANSGVFAITVNRAEVSASLTFDAASASLSESTIGALNIVGGLVVQAGTVLLRHANTIGSITETGGLLEAYADGALGTGLVTLDGGEFTGMAGETVNNQLAIDGEAIIDAATGTTLDFANGNWSIGGLTDTLQFGSAVRKGVVEWHTNATTAPGEADVIDVAGGTLRAADSGFSKLTQGAIYTSVAAGAVIDLNGFSANIGYLQTNAPSHQGDGSIVNTGAAAKLTLGGATFAGVISGNISVDLTGVNDSGGPTAFGGANTYTGATTIESGVTLLLYGKGSVAGPIIDKGVLAIYVTGTSTPGLITGAGSLQKEAAGTLVLDQTNLFSGGANILGGKVLLGNHRGFGTGALVVDNARIIGTATETATNALVLRGTDTLAAATGTTLTLTGGDEQVWDARTEAFNLTFGDAADTGTVVLGGGAGEEIISYGTLPIHVRVAYGTLKDANYALGTLLYGVTDVTVAAGARLDAAGTGLILPSLNCAGSIINSSATTTDVATRGSGRVTGVISGRLDLEVQNGTLTLSGANTYNDGTWILFGATLDLTATGSVLGDIRDNGTLVLAAPSRFTGTILGFAQGATVDLKNITAGSAAKLAFNATTGILTVTDGAHTDTVKFAAGLAAGNFVAAYDGASGTDINWQAPPAAIAAPAPLAAAKTPAIQTPDRLIAAMASFHAPHASATMLIAPTMPLQPALAMSH